MLPGSGQRRSRRRLVRAEATPSFGIRRQTFQIERTGYLVESNDAFDFTVVGGGIVGMCMAYGLLRKGHRVVVLDEDDRAFRASRGNFALLWLHTKGLDMPDYSRWTRRSLSLWPRFARELLELTAIDVGLEQRGGFLLALSDAELEGRVRDRERLQALLGNDCHPIEILGRNALQSMLPELGPDVVGGSFCPLDGHVNVLRLFGALHRACELLGVSYRPHHVVDRIETDRDGFRIVAGSQTLRSAQIVLAAGLGNARLAPMVGLDAPVRAERGQIIVTEKLERFLDYPIGNIRQTDEGGVMIGASKEDAGFDTGTTTPVLADLASDAVRVFPILARARIVRTWSALRVLSPDGSPLYDRSRTHPGAVLVTCHSGITLAAAHALDLAPAIADGEWDEGLDIFSAKRFSNVQATA